MSVLKTEITPTRNSQHTIKYGAKLGPFVGKINFSRKMFPAVPQADVENGQHGTHPGWDARADAEGGSSSQLPDSPYIRYIHQTPRSDSESQIRCLRASSP